MKFCSFEKPLISMRAFVFVLTYVKSLASDLCVIWICYSVQTQRYQDQCCMFCGKYWNIRLWRQSLCQYDCFSLEEQI